MIRGLEDLAKQYGIEPPKKTVRPQKQPGDRRESIDSAAERIPMMYRAQIRGRCSLQDANNNKDLERWTQEWVNPDSDRHDQPLAQYAEPVLGLDGDIYRMKVKFPWRVFTNGGHDSILRPALGKDGIPIVPGSGIKGLFERLSRMHPDPKIREKIRSYCGDAENQGLLRFHRAYPTGDWAGTRRVRYEKYGQAQIETRYRMVDVVHPQQKRQVEGEGSPRAIAVMSFFEPELIFEMSCQPRLNLDEAGWERIKGLLKRALRPGIGGKTSSGYGIAFPPKDKYSINLKLRGTGVSALLRSNEPEFRPNLFKATLRGHTSRLLSGVSGDERAVKQAVNRLFGGPEGPGNLNIYWDMPSKPQFLNQGNENTPIYQATGTLRLAVEQSDLIFCNQLITFAFVMGGWGKSWRRAWHKGPIQWHPGFMPSYESRAIGCHWEWLDSEDIERPKLETLDDLKQFLSRVQKACKRYLNVSSEGSLRWKETWNPNRLAVYAALTTDSKAIHLFHDSGFKTTPAIGGRKLGDRRPTSFSSVWHRMLPVQQGYLEIVTVFYGDRSPWLREKVDQLPLFINSLEEGGLMKVYGGSVPARRNP
jgi:CRISPR-associated protein Cmr6